MGQRGQAIIETIVATAIVVLVLGAALSAAITASAHFGSDPARTALDAALQREMRTARNLVKYEHASLAPASIETTIPLADGSPLPATLHLTLVTPSPGGIVVTIAAQATWNGAVEHRSMTSGLLVPAPLPGTSSTLPGLAPAPTGAP